MDQSDIILVYDKECVGCKYYCQIIKIREELGELKLVNARETSEIMDEINNLGLDMDKGMVLKMGDKFYYGADAINALALISSRSDLFNHINHWLFRSKRRADFIFPVMMKFRKIMLKLSGKPDIENLGPE